MKKNVVLMRVSTDMQETISQKNAIEKYIQENKIVVDKWIEEEGVSGFKTKLEDREGLQTLISMALNNELETVIVFNQDRIGRRTELITFVQLMSEQGVKIISITEGLINEGNDSSELMQFLKFWTAKQESMKTSLRVKAGRRATIEKNNYSGGVPNFGYRVENKSLVIDEVESQIVTFIFNNYISNGFQDTLEQLNNNKVLKRGESWTKSKVFSVLKNTIYIGKKQYQGEYLEFPELAIISDEVFNKAQVRAKARNTRGTTRYTNRTDVLFEGLLFHLCEDGVERKLNIDYVKAKDGKRVHSYRCKHCKEIKANITKNFNSTKIEPLIIDNLKSIMNSISAEELERKYNEDIEQDISLLRENISLMNKNIDKKNKAIKNATIEIEKIFLGESNSDITIINGLIDKLKSEIEELEIKLKIYSKELEELKMTTSTAIYLLDKYKDFEFIYNKSNNEERKFMLQELIEKIVISVDEIRIQLNLY